jgi:hypothetical protein
MCLNERRVCRCGRNSAFLSFRDNLLPPEVLAELYCPRCRPREDWDGQTMLEDGGWVLEFDLAAAQRWFDLRGLRARATPEFCFDEGYVSWQGLAPGDEQVNRELHRRLAPLIEADLALYLKTLKEEWSAHAAKLKAAGWRKAQRC